MFCYNLNTMSLESFYQEKSPEELIKQVSEAEEKFGSKLLQKKHYDEIANLSIAEIKTQFPKRYEAYLASLISNRTEEPLIEDNPLKEFISILNNLDEYIENSPLHKSQWRGRQVNVFEDIRSELEKGQTKGYVKLPTGVGKTVLFSKLAEAIGVKTLILVPSTILVDQTTDKIIEHTDINEEEIGNHYKDLSKQITPITTASFISKVKDGSINPASYGLIIIDEAHKAMGPETQKALSKFECIKLGFTATPNYSRDRRVADYLEKEIHSLDVVEATEEGLLSNFKCIDAFTTTDISTIQSQHNEKGENGQEFSTEIEKIVNNHARNLSAVQLYQRMFDKKQAVAYCSGINHANDLAELFRTQGIEAAVISGKNSKEEKAEILKKYKEGKIKVLCNAKILVEGFDDESVSVVFNLHPTMSPVEAEQRSGRALRLDPNNRDKWAYIVDFIDQDKINRQITFSDITRVSEAYNLDNSENDTEEVVNPIVPSEKNVLRERHTLPDIDIENLKVVTKAIEVFSIMQGRIKKIEEEIKIDWNFETLREDVIAKGITSKTSYYENSKNNGWPNISTVTEMPEFPKNSDGSSDWNTFLGLEKRKKWTYAEIRDIVREMGIKNSHDYSKNAAINGWPYTQLLKEMSDFPKNMDGGMDWMTFLGKEKRKEWTYETLREDVRAKGIKSSKEYGIKAPDNQWTDSKILRDMPEFPRNSDGSSDWNTFLGKEKRKEWTYETLREDVRAKGIKSSLEYGNKSKIYQWPNFRTIVKSSQFPKNSDGSSDWKTFFGVNKKNK